MAKVIVTSDAGAVVAEWHDSLGHLGDLDEPMNLDVVCEELKHEVIRARSLDGRTPDGDMKPH